MGFDPIVIKSRLWASEWFNYPLCLHKSRDLFHSCLLGFGPFPVDPWETIGLLKEIGLFHGFWSLSLRTLARKLPQN